METDAATRGEDTRNGKEQNMASEMIESPVVTDNFGPRMLASRRSRRVNSRQAFGKRDNHSSEEGRSKYSHTKNQPHASLYGSQARYAALMEEYEKGEVSEWGHEERKREGEETNKNSDQRCLKGHNQNILKGKRPNVQTNWKDINLHNSEAPFHIDKRK